MSTALAVTLLIAAAFGGGGGLLVYANERVEYSERWIYQLAGCGWGMFLIVFAMATAGRSH